MVTSGRYGTAVLGDAIYGVNPAWQIDDGVRWDLIAQTAPRGSSDLPSRYDGGEELTDLRGARNIKAKFRLNEPSSLSWTLPHSDPACAMLTELSTDVTLWRNGVRLERCRVGSTSDDLNADTGTATYAALDYRALLSRRILPMNLLGPEWVFTQVDQSAIAWRLVELAQTRGVWGQILGAPSGSWLGLTRGLGQTTGVLRDRTYLEGQEVGEKIQQLSDVINGFDWAISPTGDFDVYYPRRGVPRSFVAHWGSNVAAVSRTVDASHYATIVRQSGADDVPSQYAVVEDVDERPGGSWHVQVGDPDVLEESTLVEKAQAELEARQLIPSYSLTLAPGTWRGPENLWLGDTLRLVVQSGHRLNVDTDVRVIEIEVDVGDDGGETVRLICDRPEPGLYRATYRDRSRISNLERR